MSGVPSSPMRGHDCFVSMSLRQLLDLLIISATVQSVLMLVGTAVLCGTSVAESSWLAAVLAVVVTTVVTMCFTIKLVASGLTQGVFAYLIANVCWPAVVWPLVCVATSQDSGCLALVLCFATIGMASWGVFEATRYESTESHGEVRVITW